MEESTRKSIGKIAIENNNKVWNFLTKSATSLDDVASVLEAAYTSLHLWSIIGKDINMARGHWLVSRAHIFSGNSDLALIHAQKCEEITHRSVEGKEDFDLFYLNEVFARVFAMKGDVEQTFLFIRKAREIAGQITDTETRDLCLSDLKSGPWFGLKVE